MTGRDLIIYILQNNLEDVQIFEDGKLPGYMTVEETAVKMKTGVETVKLLYRMKKLRGIEIGNTIYIYAC